MLVVELNLQVFQANKFYSISLDEHGNIKQPFLITCFFNWFIFSSTSWSLPRIHQNEILLSGGCVFSSVRNDCSITCSSRM